MPWLLYYPIFDWVVPCTSLPAFPVQPDPKQVQQVYCVYVPYRNCLPTVQQSCSQLLHKKYEPILVELKYDVRNYECSDTKHIQIFEGHKFMDFVAAWLP